MSEGRTLSQKAREELNAQDVGDPFIMLLEIDHDDLASPIRLANNNEDITSNGDVYSACWVNIPWPDDVANKMPTFDAVIDNVNRNLTDDIRALTTPLTITMSIVLASDPDTVELGPVTFTSESYSLNSRSVRIRFSRDDFVNMQFGKEKFTPENTPGLFE